MIIKRVGDGIPDVFEQAERNFKQVSKRWD